MPDTKILPPEQTGARTRYLLFAIVAVGIGVRLWHINWGLPEIYEEAIPLKISWQFWNWGHTGLDFNPNFYTYPAFTFYLQFAVQSIHYVVGHLLGVYSGLEKFHEAYIADPTIFVILARLVTTMFDIGTIVVVYLIAAQYKDRRVGLVAACVVALNPLHVKQAHLINVDTPLTFFVVLSVLFLIKLYHEPDVKWSLLSGISIGLAAATKYNGALLVPVLLVAHLLRSDSIVQALKSLKSVSLIAGLALCVIVFMFFNPYIFLRYNDFIKDFSSVEQHMETGHLGLDSNTSTAEYYVLQSLPGILGWPLLLIAAVSAGFLLFGKKKINFVLLAFPIFYLGTISTWAMRADRYIFPVIPFFIIFSAMGIIKFWDEIEKKVRAFFYRFASVLVLGMVILPTPLAETIHYHRSLAKPDTRTITKKWIDNHLPPGSAIASGPYGVDLSEKRFLLFSIPFDAMTPETTIPFYDTQWYEDLDLLITSDYDYGRYRQEPQRYSEILQFYDSLSANWHLVFKAEPGDTSNGPTFWLYQPPRSSGKSFSFEKMWAYIHISDSVKAINFFGKLARILQAKAKLDKSEELFRFVLTNDPQNILAYKNLADIQYRLEQNDEALATVRKYLQLKPDDPAGMSLEGSILIRLNRLDDAEAKLREALKLDNHIESAYLDLSIIYASRNERQNMIDILSQYLALLPPNSAKAGLVRKRIKELTTPD